MGNEGSFKEINLLTDILFLDKHDNCQAGENTFVLSPSGKYILVVPPFPILKIILLEILMKILQRNMVLVYTKLRTVISVEPVMLTNVKIVSILIERTQKSIMFHHHFSVEKVI